MWPEPAPRTAPRGAKVGTRLAALALLVYARGRVTGDDLARHLDVTARTVYRDIARLQQAGFPIVAAPGPGGGVMFDDSAGMEHAANSVDGVLDLLTKTGLLAGQTRPGDDGLAAIRRHLADELDDSDWQTITKARERILFDPEEWYARDRPPADFHLLRDAVIHDQQLRIRYLERDGSRVDVDHFDAYGLVWKGGFWYLLGYSNTANTVRRVRVNRILDVEPTGSTFIRPSGFTLVETWKRHLEDFGKGTKLVVLRIAREAVADFEHFNWKHDNKITKTAAHWTVEMRVDNDTWLVPLVLSYAGAVTVLEPAELRHRIQHAARATLAAHDDATPNEPHPASPPGATDDTRARAGIHRRSLSD